MGLDSVELIVSVEKKFGISIPDKECKKIYTVEDFANVVYQKIRIHPTKNCVTQILFYRIRKSLIELNVNRENIEPKSKISELIHVSELKEQWCQIEKKIELKLPTLVDLDFDKKLDTHVTFLGFKIFKRTYPITEGTIRQLIDWIISLNFNEIIEIDKITSKYEVERIISGIISENMGIPISEIKLEHSITNDLGID